MGNRGPLTRLLQQRYDALKADNDRLRRELEEAQAELARMRPVVEAGERYFSNQGDFCTLLTAIYAYRAGTGKAGE